MAKGQRGPAVGGSLTQWHAHDDMFPDPVKAIAITQLPDGGCPAGEAVLDVYGIEVQPVSS